MSVSQSRSQEGLCHLLVRVTAGLHPRNLPCGKQARGERALLISAAIVRSRRMCRPIQGLNYQKCNGRQNGEDLSGHFEL